VCLKSSREDGAFNAAKYEVDWLRKMHGVLPKHFPQIHDLFEQDGAACIVMELLVGYTDLGDYIKENAGNIPSKVADEIMEQILMICDKMHTTVLSTTIKKFRKKKNRELFPDGKPIHKYCAHADFHNENIMIRVKDDNDVNVVVIDPHKQNMMKKAEPWFDMTFVARHAIGLTLTAEEVAAARTARNAMKNVILTGLKKDHPRVYDFVRKCLGEKAFPKLVIANDFCQMPPGMWEFGRKYQEVATASKMLEFMNRGALYDLGEKCESDTETDCESDTTVSDVELSV